MWRDHPGRVSGRGDGGGAGREVADGAGGVLAVVAMDSRRSLSGTAAGCVRGGLSDRDQRAAHLEEGLEILRRAWTEERFSFDGQLYHLHDARVMPRPVQKPHPPLWIGARGKNDRDLIEYVRALIRADQEQAARQRLEAKLLEAVERGDYRGVTPEFWNRMETIARDKSTLPRKRRREQP